MKMKLILFIWISVIALLAAGVQIVANKASNEQKSAHEPQEVLLELKKNVTNGSFTTESRFSHQDLFVPKSGLVDNKGNIFVLDGQTCEIFKFSPKGKLLKKNGRKGGGPGENTLPMKILLNRDRIYVIDYQRPYVNIFDLELNFLEQKKFPNLFNALDAAFINDNQFVVSSPVLPIMYRYKYFIFNSSGELSMKVKIDFDSPADVTRQPDFLLKYANLLAIDHETGDFWSARISSYHFEHYGKDYELLNVIKGNLQFKTQDLDAGQAQGTRITFKVPSDRGKFFRVSGNKIYYGYLFNKETILDVISKDFKVVRFKMSHVRGIFDLIDENRILVNIVEENSEDGQIEENDFIAIMKLND
ncbi:MAG: 6-bladed beta-propeller [Candidatus Aminicenantes bacterium]|jgi:hypothetical protein